MFFLSRDGSATGLPFRSSHSGLGHFPPSPIRRKATNGKAEAQLSSGSSGLLLDFLWTSSDRTGLMSMLVLQESPCQAGRLLLIYVDRTCWVIRNVDCKRIVARPQHLLLASFDDSLRTAPVAFC